MKAALLYDVGDIRVEEVPELSPGPGEVVIDVACVQPSVTECVLIASEGLRMRLAAGPARFGGHEFAGVVTAVGRDVDTLRSGQRVTAVETVTCGRCGACRRDRPDACVNAQYIGFSRPGAFADQVAVPAGNVVAVPDGVSASATAAIQPLAGAIHGHGLAQVQPGESVLILGAGVMGLLHLQVARRGGAGFVAITGRSPAKLELARRFGADAVWGPEVPVREAIKEATDGVGADVVFETAGGAATAGLSGTSTVELAFRAVRRGGRIVVVSVLDRTALAPIGLLREKNVALLHPSSGAGGYSPSASVFEYALRLVARGDVDVEALVTHRLTGIEELPTALEITRAKGAHGAINPAQVTAAGAALWPC